MCCYISRIELETGHAEAAVESARRAVETFHEDAPYRSVALASLARAELAVGRNEDALARAEGAIAIIAGGAIEEGEALVRLTHAEALRAAGRDSTEADAALVRWLEERAARIRDEELRRSFLEIPEHRAIRALAR